MHIEDRTTATCFEESFGASNKRCKVSIYTVSDHKKCLMKDKWGFSVVVGGGLVVFSVCLF